jgi:putative membrane protein
LADKKKTPFIENFDLTRWKEAPFLMMKGFLMGSADIVPGVSGGTMALITGIYDRLIFAIKSINAKAVSHILRLRLQLLFEQVHWKFFLLLGFGMVLAIIFFTRVVPLQIYMFTHPEIVYGLFFGLILGSIVLLIREIDSNDRNWKNTLPLAAGALFGYWVVNLVPGDTPETFWFVFLTGSIAISAMVLPGISGSYILLIFNKYDYILTQLSYLGTDNTFAGFLNLIPFILGMIAGIVAFSRILSWLLKNYRTVTLTVLIGFLIGSLYVIWPFQEREYYESVIHVEIMEVTNPVVKELMTDGTDANRPEYLRIGRVADMNGDTHNATSVEVETVSKKLVSNKPLSPWSSQFRDAEHINKRGGLFGILLGLLMIIGISYLRKK